MFYSTSWARFSTNIFNFFFWCQLNIYSHLSICRLVLSVLTLNSFFYTSFVSPYFCQHFFYTRVIVNKTVLTSPFFLQSFCQPNQFQSSENKLFQHMELGSFTNAHSFFFLPPGRVNIIGISVDLAERPTFVRSRLDRNILLHFLLRIGHHLRVLV